MSHLNNTIYARPENLVFAKSAFSKQDLAKIDQVKEIVMGSLKTRHLGFNFTINKDTYSQDIAKHFDVFVCIKSFDMSLTDFKREIKLDIGDYISFPSQCNYSTKSDESSYIYFEVYYWPKVEYEEPNGQAYNIIATLTDKYEIKVFANSEKEAYDKAYNIPLSDWKHLTPGGTSKPRKILRWAQWGDFETKEIPS